MKTITVKMTDELHKKFKILSIERSKDMQSILVEYIEKITTENQEDKK